MQCTQTKVVTCVRIWLNTNAQIHKETKSNKSIKAISRKRCTIKGVIKSMILNWDCLYCLYQWQEEGMLSLYRSPSDSKIERCVSVFLNWVEGWTRFSLTADNKQRDMCKVHLWFCVHAAAICLDNVSCPMGVKQEVRVSQTYALIIYCVSVLIT